jgi:predicted kinase
MKSVFILQHVHVRPSGEDDVKLIGAYSSRERALEAVGRLRTQPGFCEHPRLVDPVESDDPNGFYIDEYTVDHDDWAEGYVRGNTQSSVSSTGRLIIVCGLPCSGKTTLARALEEANGAVRLCPDEWMDALGISLHDEQARGRIEALQWTLAQRLLASGSTVIVEWGTWARSERDALRDGARALGAAVELRYLPATPDRVIERMERRARENPPVSRETIHQWFEVFQAPTADELASYDGPAKAEPSALPPE